MLIPGDLVAPFESTTLDGRAVPHDQLWQHRNFVLVLFPGEYREAASAYLSRLDHRLSDLKPPDTSLVISHRAIDGLPMNHIVIADRWGEVIHIEQLGADVAAWPAIDDLVEWVEFTRMQCPECPP